MSLSLKSCYTTSAVLSDLGVRHGFTGRADGVSSGRFASLNLGGRWGDSLDNVQKNLQIVATQAGFLPADLCMMRQVHGTQVIPVSREQRQSQEADGLATDEDLVLGVLSADCVALLLADGRGRVSAVHAGWRGTVAGIARDAVTALCRLGARPEEIRVALGPSIGPCCFCVGPEVAEHFARVTPAAVVPLDPKPHVNLWEANRRMLLQSGILEEHISSDPRCTHCNPDQYFSYRRDGAGIGQQLAFIIGGQA